MKLKAWSVFIKGLMDYSRDVNSPPLHKALKIVYNLKESLIKSFGLFCKLCRFGHVHVIKDCA